MITWTISSPPGHSCRRHSSGTGRRTEQVTGPSAQVAFKDGQPTPAAQAFAKKVGIDVGRLERVATPKGEYLAATVTRKGRTAGEILSRSPAEGNRVPLLAQEHVLARTGRSVCAPGALAGCNARLSQFPMELFGIAAESVPRTPHHWREAGRSPNPAPTVETLRAAKVLGAGEREQTIRKALDAATAHHPRRALARRQPLLTRSSI